LTEAQGRTALLGATARATVGSDPTVAFALGDQVAPTDRRKFLDAVFSGWANQDTDAALRWLDQVPDQAERDAALAAIRTVAPVGIGAALTVKDGYPIINQLVPGTPADLSGQLHAGDRIIALAQGDNSFIDARTLSLQDIVQMVRGAPGSLLQLQVLSADAPPDSPPRTVPIIRDQIKYKR
jgi:C-terminal processing protease CtpA/Prc